MTGLSRARTAVTVVTAVVGSLIAVWLFAAVPADGGDVDLRLDVRPSLRGGVVLEAPPLGTLSADAFVGVARVAIEVGDVRPAAAEAAVSQALAGKTPAVLEQDPVAVFTDGVTSGLARLAVAAVVVGTLGGAVAAAALRRTPAAAAGGAGVGAATVLLMVAVAALTYDPYAFQEPRATGAFAVRSAMGDPGGPGSGSVAESGPAAPTVPQPDVGSMLGKLQRNLTGLYNGFLLPEVSRTARAGSEPVVVALPGTDPSLLSALASSSGASTLILLSGGPFVSSGEAPQTPSVPGVARVLTYEDLPQTVGGTTVYRHPSGPVTLAGPGATSLVIGPDAEPLPRAGDVPHVAMDSTNRVLVVYLDPDSGVLRAYDVVDSTEDTLDVVRSNADGLR